MPEFGYEILDQFGRGQLSVKIMMASLSLWRMRITTMLSSISRMNPRICHPFVILIF